MFRKLGRLMRRLKSLIILAELGGLFNNYIYVFWRLGVYGKKALVFRVGILDWD